MRRVALAAVLLATSASADEHKLHVRFVADVAGGACSRYDDATGTLGGCGAAAAGIDLRFGVWHFPIELGLGFTPTRTTLDAATGVQIVGGGAYGLLRVMPFSFYADRFFMNVGAELRPQPRLSTLGLGVLGVVEVGVRLPIRDLEIGVRVGAGEEIARFGDAMGSTARFAFAFTA